ncbi:hypothetical protein Ciccas_006536 [Cichlidogyrus casuarinus]|uniref:ceramide glucosyltransferase n=1 Tax=Cichlidogyrus casuarinus TaxID=1844966 RepID=A0ABD2Q5G4_9PLAT
MFPQVDSKLLVGQESDTVLNPMVNNMLKGYNVAKHELIWILQDLVTKSMDPKVAIVHQIPFFTDHPSFTNIVDKICSGCYLSRNYIALNTLGVSCFTGMSYLIKKPLLDDLGGLKNYGMYLAEDYFISDHLHERGYKVVLSCWPAQQNIANTNLQVYRNRMVRWLRLRLNMIPHIAMVIEPLNETLLLGCLSALALNYHFQCSVLLAFSAHILLWLILDRILLGCVQGGPLRFGTLQYLAGWFVKEVTVLLVFFEGLANMHFVTWGPRTYYLKWGGVISHVAKNDNRASNNSNALPVNSSRKESTKT